MKLSPQARRRLIGALTVFLLAVAGILAETSGNDIPAPPAPPAVKAPVTVTTGGPVPATVTVPAAALEQAKPSLEQGLATPKDLTRAGVHLGPLASPTQPGCKTTLVRNFSPRPAGVRPRLIVLHYTVSPNRPGWGDVDAIVALFDRASFQASSNYVIDNEGHCALLVAETDKAWTQGNMNPQSACSFEVVNSGSEPTYIGPASGPGMGKLARVVSDCAARWHIPLQAGATSGCTVTRAGVVDHDELACGNAHTDIRPFTTGPVIAAARAVRARETATTATLTAGEQANVTCLQAERRSARRHGGWDHLAPSHLRHASACKAGLRRSITWYRTHPHPNAATRASRRARLETAVKG